MASATKLRTRATVASAGDPIQPQFPQILSAPGFFALTGPYAESNVLRTVDNNLNKLRRPDHNRRGRVVHCARHGRRSRQEPSQVEKGLRDRSSRAINEE